MGKGEGRKGGREGALSCVVATLPTQDDNILRKWLRCLENGSKFSTHLPKDRTQEKLNIDCHLYPHIHTC